MQMHQLPTPRGLPVLGQLLDLSKPDIYRVLEDWAPEHGPMFTVRMPGREVLVIADGELARQVIRARPTKFARYRVMRDVIEEIGVKGVFTAEGEAWRRQRRLVMAGFNSRALLASFDRVADITLRLRDHLRAKNGEPVDVVGDLMRYAIDVTGVVALGRDFDTIRRGPDVLRNHLQIVFPSVARRMAFPLPYWRYGIKLAEDRRLEESIRAVSEIVFDLIREARARLDAGDIDTPRNMIEALLLARDDDDASSHREGSSPTGQSPAGPPSEFERSALAASAGPRGRSKQLAGGKLLTDHEVYSNVLSILLAGEDTTANTAAWMLHYAARLPRVAHRLRQEAEAAFEGEVLTSHDGARKMPYTAAVAYEAGRLRPVGAVLFLEALEGAEVGGVFVPARTPVFVLSRYIMTDARNFGRPDEFLPERWLDDERPADLAHASKLDFSFGGGPRICPGRPLALLETAMVASMVAKGFDLEPATAEVGERIGFTLGPRNLKLRFHPR